MALENLQLTNSFLGKMTVQPLLELLIKETSIPEMKCQQKNEEKKKQMRKMEIDGLNL